MHAWPLLISIALTVLAPRSWAGEEDPLPEGEQLAALPPDGGEEFNRLVFETSPYLRQHARNPVDWFPWGPEAFRAATLRKKPILLSVGYSTCHWCHVMERESFEDPQVATLLNETFVCIKVDREERPDIDAVYMLVTQALTGSAGWPNTVLLTPDGEPFFAATYLPPRGRYGRMGLVEVCQSIAESWRSEREALDGMASEVTRILGERVSARPAGELGPETLDLAVRVLAGQFDAEHGGFGPPPRFPATSRLGLLLRHHRRTGHPHSLEMVRRQLDSMRAGGLYDHLAGGFHRYSTDARWFLPHFEKMLYDQALLASAYCEAYQLTGDGAYAATVRGVLDHVLAEFSAPEGGFYSAVDADSEGREGAFYLWTPEELERVLGEEDGDLAAAWFGVSEEGNFIEEGSGQRTGESLLAELQDLEPFAAARGLEPGDLADRLATMRGKLLAAREQRERPFRDEKILTDWNALAIAALARAGRALGDEEYTARAERALEFLWRELRGEDGRVRRLWHRGEASGPGLLTDHAYLAEALLEMYRTTLDARHLERSIELCEAMLEHFLDEQHGGLFLTPDDGEALILRPKEAYDGALPSGNSVAATTLVRLARLTGRADLEQAARAILDTFAGEVAADPAAHSHMLQALELLEMPTYELVVVSPDTDHAREALAPLQRAFLPHVALLSRPAGEAPITALAPFTAEQTALEGRPTYYLCRDFTCEAPTTDGAALLERLRAVGE